jgi:hypothetical protein
MSCSYLKIHPSNHISFKCTNHQKILEIRNQYKKQEIDGQTIFESIYRLNIQQMFIRELLLLQSIFHCDNGSDILNLVKMQGNPTILYYSFLELERKNMIAILAFDS